MAKLTLSFRTRKLKVFTLGDGETLIGRDPDCDIAIDSLAVEPRHARLLPVGESFTVDACSDEAAVRVNGEKIGEPVLLKEGDEIGIGKHTLSFSLDADTAAASSRVTRFPTVGWLQIQNGSHLGRTIRLDRAFTRIGKPDAELAVIARRGDGYFLTHLKGENNPVVNGKSIGDQVCRLVNGDRLSVGVLELQFFTDTCSAQQSDIPPVEQGDSHQRRFSRIPFDVAVTLREGERSWQSTLIDLSLHGALIRSPEGFESGDSDGSYRLSIHLEGGPDIDMDVHIAHHEDGQLGLVCDDIDVDSITHLRRLVELNLGDPQLLERELSALG